MAGPAVTGVAAAETSEGAACRGEAKSDTAPAPIVRLVLAGIADGLATISVPAATVVPPE